MSLLVVDEVSLSFGGVQALDEVSLRIEPGELLGLIGPNGAGKTTLFNTIGGVLSPDAGHILFDGDDILSLPPHRRAARGIARTFQNLELFSDLTVLENVMVPVDAASRSGVVSDALRLRPALIAGRRARERARAILHFLGILHTADTRAGDLSFGQQRRVELGRALAMDPRLLLLDEPAAGLDTNETAELADLLTRIRERFLVTMFLVDHDMALVMRACDHIYVLDFGRILTDGSPADILENAQVIEAYLGEEVA